MHMVGKPGFPKSFAQDYFQQPGVGFGERGLLLWFMTQPEGMWCAREGVGFSEPLGPGGPCGLSHGAHHFQCVSSSLLLDVTHCCTLPCHPAEVCPFLPGFSLVSPSSLSSPLYLTPQPPPQGFPEAFSCHCESFHCSLDSYRSQCCGLRMAFLWSGRGCPGGWAF